MTSRGIVALETRPFDVVGLGVNALDLIAVIDGFPQPDAKHMIDEVEIQGGGMTATAMVACARLGAIRRTLLPLSYPALIGAGLYTFLLAWNEFLFAVVLIEAWEKRVITMAIYSLLAEFVTEWSMMMAYSVLASAPLVLAFVFLQRYMVRGMTAGAVTQ